MTCFVNKMKSHTKIPHHRNNSKINRRNRCKIDTLNTHTHDRSLTHTHDRSLSWLETGTSINSGGLN